MKTMKALMALALVFVLGSAFTTADKAKKDKDSDDVVYILGVAASFNDSIVYFTQVQELRGVCLEKKTGFLPGRSGYAYQMKNFIEQTYQKPNYTCMIYFSKKRKTIDKEVTRMMKKYQAQKAKGQLTTIDTRSFQFKVDEAEE